MDEQWEPLLIATADNALFYKHHQKATREDVIYFMTFERRNPNSIVSCLSEARENARTIRETITKEMWECINSLYLQIKQASFEDLRRMDELQRFFEEIKKNCQLYHGIVDSTFTRNEAWHFGRMGRHIERADKSSRFLDVKYFTMKQEHNNASGSTYDLMTWTAVLKSVSAYNMYRQTHKDLTPLNIVGFLILDRLFPRSIAYCMRQAEISLYAITGSNPDKGYNNDAEKKLSRLRSEIEYYEAEDIFKTGLHQFLDDFQIRNNEIDDAIFDLYFGLKPVSPGSQSQVSAQ